MRSASERTCRGEWMTTSCRPTAARRAKSPSGRSPSRDHGPKAGNLFGTTRTRQPGVSGGRPGGPMKNVSGGVADSRPSQKGQPTGSSCSAPSPARGAPGRAGPGRRNHDPAPRERVAAELRRRVAFGQPVSPVPLPRKGAEQVDRQRQDQRGRALGAHLEHRLQVAELERDRVRRHDVGRVLEALGGLELALGGDHLCAPLALGLRLPRHRPLHAGRDLDVLDLDDRDLDAPGRGGLVDDLLQDRVDLVALREELVEDVLAEDAAQRRLRDLRGRDHEVLDLHDRPLGVDDPEVRDRVHAHGHVVLRDHFLRRDVEGHRAQVDPHHLVDDRDEQEEARALRRRVQPAEPEDDAPLVLPRDAHREREQEDEDDDNGCDCDQGGVHRAPFRPGRVILRGRGHCCGLLDARDLEHEVIADALDPHVLAPPDRLAAGGRLPDLPVDVDEARGVERRGARLRSRRPSPPGRSSWAPAGRAPTFVIDDRGDERAASRRRPARPRSTPGSRRRPGRRA